MTGMGDDGARGTLDMEEAGAVLNIARDEQTSIGYDMPRDTVNAGGVDKIVPLEQIAAKVIFHYQGK